MPIKSYKLLLIEHQFFLHFYLMYLCSKATSSVQVTTNSTHNYQMAKDRCVIPVTYLTHLTVPIKG